MYTAKSTLPLGVVLLLLLVGGTIASILVKDNKIAASRYDESRWTLDSNMVDGNLSTCSDGQDTEWSVQLTPVHITRIRFFGQNDLDLPEIKVMLPSCPKPALVLRSKNIQDWICEDGVDTDYISLRSPLTKFCEIQIFTGPISNVAVRKQALQSSTFNATDADGHVIYEAVANLAVDGVITENHVNKTCALTERLNDLNCTDNPWWRVALGETYEIYAIDIYGPEGTWGDSMGDGPMMIRAGSDVVFEDTSQRIGSHVTVQFKTPLLAANVTISLTNCTTLTLCEVDIFGARKKDDCSSSPCLNSATCQDTVDSFVCLCQPGYTGRHCETDINECDSDPCQNRATCENLMNEYVCQCLEGYTGTQCELDVDDCAEAPCQNNGVCYDGVATFTCVCQLGYSGPQCESGVEEAVTLTCGDTGFHVEVNVSTLQSIDPYVPIDDVIFGNRSCKGRPGKGLRSYHYPYSECLTKSRVSETTVDFSNSLISEEVAPESGRRQVSGSRWNVPITCSMPVGEEELGGYVVQPPKSGYAGHMSSSARENVAKIQFYSDSSFTHHLPTDPLTPGLVSTYLGKTLYVSVGSVGALPADVRMVVRSCNAMSRPKAPPEQHTPVLVNGCAAPGVTIIGRLKHVTFFSFQAFSFDDSAGSVYVTCDLHLCKDSEDSDICKLQCP